VVLLRVVDFSRLRWSPLDAPFGFDCGVLVFGVSAALGAGIPGVFVPGVVAPGVLVPGLVDPAGGVAGDVCANANALRPIVRIGVRNNEALIVILCPSIIVQMSGQCDRVHVLRARGRKPVGVR
jgi:hypothetical protein